MLISFISFISLIILSYLVHPEIQTIVLNVHADLGGGIIHPYCQTSYKGIFYHPSKEDYEIQSTNLYPLIFERVHRLLEYRRQQEDARITRAMKWLGLSLQDKEWLFSDLHQAYEECINGLMTRFMEMVFPTEKSDLYLDAFAVMMVSSSQHNTILKQKRSLDADTKRDLFFVYECFSICYLCVTLVFSLLALPIKTERINVGVVCISIIIYF